MNKPPRSIALLTSWLAQRKRVRNQDKQKTKEGATQPPSQDIEATKDNESQNNLSKLGIIETANGLEYLPPIPSGTKKRRSEKSNAANSRAKRQEEQRNLQKKMKMQTPCKFYQRGRCRKKDCEFLHDGPPPLCYNLLKEGICNDETCIYSHDTKKVGCMFFHVTHNCTRGDTCKFSHDPISAEELAELKRIHDEVEMEKHSTMPADIAQAMLQDDKAEEDKAKEENKEKIEEETFENVPSMLAIVEDQAKEEVMEAKESEDSSFDPDEAFFSHLCLKKHHKIHQI